MNKLLARLLLLLTAPLRVLPFTKGMDRFLVPRLSNLNKLGPALNDLSFGLPKLRLQWSARPFPDILTRTLLIKGIYQEDVIVAFRHLLQNPHDVLIDVGAHHGLMSLSASRIGHPSLKIFAFEPNPRSLPILRENISLNATANITVLPLGLSDSITERPFFANTGEHSWNSTFVEEFANKNHLGHIATVKTTTLDHFCAEHQLAPTVLKIDTEGFDFFVLKGAHEVIKQFLPHILVEFNPIAARKAGLSLDEIASFLLGLGYELRVLQRSWHGGYSFATWKTLLKEDIPNIQSLENVVCLSPKQ